MTKNYLVKMPMIMAKKFEKIHHENKLKTVDMKLDKKDFLVKIIGIGLENANQK